jgi:hypothetical protein
MDIPESQDGFSSLPEKLAWLCSRELMEREREEGRKK